MGAESEEPSVGAAAGASSKGLEVEPQRDPDEQEGLTTYKRSVTRNEEAPNGEGPHS